MYKKFLIVFLFTSFIFTGEAQARFTAYLNIMGGTSYWNSRGLNRLTEGFNSGYGTTFSSIHFPYELFMETGIRYGDWAFGFIYGFDYVRRNSISPIYAFTETIKMTFMPFGFTSKYFWYSNDRISLSSGLVLTFYKINLSMTSYPNPLGEEDVSMKAWAQAITATIDFDYRLTNRMFFISTLGFRYARSVNFRYTSSTGNHNADDYVLFNDGTNLTINLSGLNFLMGLKFYFGEI